VTAGQFLKAAAAEKHSAGGKSGGRHWLKERGVEKNPFEGHFQRQKTKGEGESQKKIHIPPGGRLRAAPQGKANEKRLR